MVTPSAGAVVLVSFPFSDLSSHKLRPACVLADAGRGDWILCQITSNPYADPNAIVIQQSDFLSGSLQRISYLRPGKLFTANKSIIRAVAGHLTPQALDQIQQATATLILNNG